MPAFFAWTKSVRKQSNSCFVKSAIFSNTKYMTIVFNQLLQRLAFQGSGFSAM